MDYINNEMKVNADVFEKRYGYDLCDSKRDAFNSVLYRFSTKKIDPRYGLSSNLFLSNENEKYYFDSFKFLYPLTDNNFLVAINNELINDSMSIVIKSNEKILIEKYDFSKNYADFSEYSLINDDIDDMGLFLFYLSKNSSSELDKLKLVDEMFIKEINGNVVVLDKNNDVIDFISCSNESFFNNCMEYFQDSIYSVKKGNANFK